MGKKRKQLAQTANTHTLQTTGTLAASKHVGLPKPSSLISVHAGTLPCSPVSVPPCDPVWVSPGLSSIPGALPLRGSLLLDLCVHHSLSHIILPLFLYSVSSTKTKLPAGRAPVCCTALSMSNTQKTPAQSGGKDGRKGKVGSLGRTCTHALFKMDNQQGPTVQHLELCSMLCGSLDGRGIWGRMDVCTCMT